jgi:quinol monooxygenase YgiN
VQIVAIEATLESKTLEKITIMSIKVIVELRVKEDKLPAIPLVFSKLLAETRCQDGNEGVDLITDQDMPAFIVLIEQWKSQKHYEDYYDWREKRGDFAKLAPLFELPPEHRLFDYFDV